ncbi:Aldose reductase-related protein 2 [Heterocephalus glaber]|uniref:Aldose reductase-related protein 2 n=1 Tax=Heterocephalus glaber TaxID=10181 RepID=G5BQY0_HETGA|nr:Aldose reductase-related protein 2 [Heterocephalus glaber]
MAIFLELSTKAKMPIVGLGTWKSLPSKVKEAVKVASNAGYHHMDCAYMYQNENEVGEAIQRRSERRMDFRLGRNSSRDNNGNILPSEVTFLDVWEVLEELVNKELVKALGGSNFNHFQVKKLLIKPVLPLQGHHCHCLQPPGLSR